MGGKGSGRRPAAPCGTTAAYKRHRKRGENCDVCKQAQRDWARQRNGYNGIRVAGRSVKERTRLKLQRQRLIVRQWKLDAGNCGGCGLVIDERTVVCIDCDHIDPSTKTFSISQGIGRYADNILKMELSKCQPLCRNCHALRTHDEQHHLTTKIPYCNQYNLFDGVGHGN